MRFLRTFVPPGIGQEEEISELPGLDMSAHKGSDFMAVDDMPEDLEWRLERTQNNVKGFWLKCSRCASTLHAWKGIEVFYCNTCSRRVTPGEARKIQFILRMETM